MSTEKNKAIIRRIVDAINQRDLTLVDELFAPSFVDHSRPGLPPGVEGPKQFFTTFFHAFPDGEVTIDDMFGEGDKVVVRGHIRGTHEGELMGIPPTGRQVAISIIDINRIEDGRMVERWANQDDLGLFQQLGVISSGAD